MLLDVEKSFSSTSPICSAVFIHDPTIISFFNLKYLTNQSLNTVQQNVVNGMYLLFNKTEIHTDRC